MTAYVVRRLIQAVPIILIVSIVGFAIIQATGDPLAAYTVDASLTGDDIARLRAKYGLDQPVPVQYLNWLKNLLTGDWGRSFYTKKPVIEMVFDWLPNTILLASVSYSMTLTVAIVLGIITAVRQYSLFDHIVTGISFVGIATPSFWMGLMLIFILAVRPKAAGLPYLPVGGMFDPRVGETLPQVLWHVILPAFTLSFVMTASYIRYIRSSILEELHLDYVRTARSKGLKERIVFVRHVLKNALLPLLTLIGLSIPSLLSGTIVIESMFAWPGMGRLFWRAAERVDIPILMALLMLVSVLTVLSSIVTDILYAAVDPRIRYT
jgi:peptide/nickel transport system permease protein